MAALTLSYGSECRVPREEDLRSLQTAEIMFIRTVRACPRPTSMHDDDTGVALGADELRLEGSYHANTVRQNSEEYAPHGEMTVGRPRLRWWSSEQAPTLKAEKYWQQYWQQHLLTVLNVRNNVDSNICYSFTGTTPILATINTNSFWKSITILTTIILTVFERP